MSVLVKCLEMPKDYEYVDVRIFRDGTATTASAEKPFYKKMDVVEVPTPHGDLIDINALKLAILDVDYVNKHDYLKGVLNAINNAPIVIPADKDGEAC